MLCMKAQWKMVTMMKDDMQTLKVYVVHDLDMLIQMKRRE
jgi:hypothetical protein